nr:hypothetical protein Iba_chr14eCG7900 [Ipomoea batatas]
MGGPWGVWRDCSKARESILIDPHIYAAVQRCTSNEQQLIHVFASSVLPDLLLRVLLRRPSMPLTNYLLYRPQLIKWVTDQGITTEQNSKLAGNFPMPKRRALIHGVDTIILSYTFLLFSNLIEWLNYSYEELKGHLVFPDENELKEEETCRSSKQFASQFRMVFIGFANNHRMPIRPLILYREP